MLKVGSFTFRFSLHSQLLVCQPAAAVVEKDEADARMKRYKARMAIVCFAQLLIVRLSGREYWGGSLSMIVCCSCVSGSLTHSLLNL